MSLLTQFLRSWWFLGISEENLEVEEFEEAQLGCGLELELLGSTSHLSKKILQSTVGGVRIGPTWMWLGTGTYHGCFDLQLLQKWYTSGFDFFWVQHCICQFTVFASPFMALDVVAILTIDVVNIEGSFDAESTHHSFSLCVVQKTRYINIGIRGDR